MSSLFSVALSVAVIAAFALAIGGTYLLLKRKERKQGLLMLLCAAVFFVNVLIWTLPTPA